MQSLFFVGKNIYLTVVHPKVIFIYFSYSPRNNFFSEMLNEFPEKIAFDRSMRNREFLIYKILAVGYKKAFWYLTDRTKLCDKSYLLWK